MEPYNSTDKQRSTMYCIGMFLVLVVVLLQYSAVQTARLYDMDDDEVDPITACRDFNGNIRQIGKQWTERQDCNHCGCTCGPEGHPWCGCTLMVCPGDGTDTPTCKDYKGNIMQVGMWWIEYHKDHPYFGHECDCTCQNHGQAKCRCTDLQKN